ncbi:hypothetical protein Tco_0362027, partial [Tanacetum coccineum]
MDFKARSQPSANKILLYPTRQTSFSCEQTAPWERTLDNPTSLTFGKFITVQEIPNDNFLEHYFNFISYNELPTKLNVRDPVLT